MVEDTEFDLFIEVGLRFYDRHTDFHFGVVAEEFAVAFSFFVDVGFEFVRHIEVDGFDS